MLFEVTWKTTGRGKAPEARLFNTEEEAMGWAEIHTREPEVEMSGIIMHEEPKTYHVPFDRRFLIETTFIAGWNAGSEPFLEARTWASLEKEYAVRLLDEFAALKPGEQVVYEQAFEGRFALKLVVRLMEDEEADLPDMYAEDVETDRGGC